MHQVNELQDLADLGAGNGPEREIISEIDTPECKEQVILVKQFVPPAFRLTVGLEYVTFSKEHMKVVYEYQNRFLGIIELPKGPYQVWYTSDGHAERDFDVCPEQDPFDVKSVHRDPDMLYLIKKDDKYTSNNCFMSRDAAVAAASERGGMVIPFKEIMDD